MRESWPGASGDPPRLALLLKITKGRRRAIVTPWAVVLDLDGVRQAMLWRRRPVRGQRFYKAYSAASLTIGTQRGQHQRSRQPHGEEPAGFRPHPEEHCGRHLAIAMRLEGGRFECALLRDGCVHAHAMSLCPPRLAPERGVAADLDWALRRHRSMSALRSLLRAQRASGRAVETTRMTHVRHRWCGCFAMHPLRGHE